MILFFIALSPILGYFAMAVLAVTPQTHAVRVALWPVVALCVLRTAASVDMLPVSADQKPPFTVSLFFIMARTFEWTLKKQPLVRLRKPANGPRSTLADALDLATSLRGLGWDWSHGVSIPSETRPASRSGFVLHVALSAIFHLAIGIVLRSAIHSFSPSEFGAPSRGSIFDETLPFHARYLRASVISFFAVSAVYAGIQALYDAHTLVGVAVFAQEPERWPPAFDAPWRATSLCDLWGRRWHQFLRHSFVTFGGYPLSLLLGKPGMIVGTFLLSGVYHYFGMAALDGRAELWRMLVGFGMMAPGILAEWAFKKCTGRKVGGAAGWLWAMGWFLLWGSVIVDGFVRGGVLGHFTFVGVTRVPGQEIVQGLVTNFDAWLHET